MPGELQAILQARTQSVYSMKAAPLIIDVKDIMTFTASGISLNSMLAGHNGTVPVQIRWDNEGLLNIQANGLKWNTVDTLGKIQLIIRSEMSENPLQHVTKTFFT